MKNKTFVRKSIKKITLQILKTFIKKHSTKTFKKRKIPKKTSKKNSRKLNVPLWVTLIIEKLSF